MAGWDKPVKNLFYACAARLPSSGQNGLGLRDSPNVLRFDGAHDEAMFITVTKGPP
jgi:hypothetical protein